MLNLIKEQDDIDKIYLYAKDLSEPKYEILIKKRKNARTKHLNDLNAFIECSDMMDNIKAAKMSALSTNNLDKYEYLTGEDLGLKPSTVEQAKFEYSPLGKVFNKGLKEEEKKEVLLKILINIEDKNEEQLHAIEDQ